MNSVEQAVETLFAALESVAGLQVVRGVGMRMDPPAATVAPPRISWGAFDDAPTEASFTVPVLVGQSERALAELLTWVLPVRAALADTGAAVGPAEPGTWPAGGGVELPAYLIQVDVGLM
jgi:hypothetical protein